ncbi:MAG: amidase [Euryarchaeota archaeon]|nr:amidase [Euryarchaeota archaeon]
MALLLVTSGCISAPETLDSDVSPLSMPSVATDCIADLNGIDLNYATVAGLQSALAAGEITSAQLVDAYVARFLAFDESGPKLNSIQGISPTAASYAAALDAERANGTTRSPMHGIPILLKDNVGTRDQATTAGSIALEQNMPPQDATLTKRLRDAGAIILGKTQLSEFANWVSLNMPSGYSSLGGQVVNAYTGGDPSGSSSGSGVAGSMAFATVTIGTETSGSILSPSNANSLVGVKPTLGLVSRAGVIPLAANFDTPGPMGRNVADVAVVLGAIAGPDDLDPATASSADHLPSNRDYTMGLHADALTGVRLGYDANSGGALFLRALDDLRRLGAEVIPIQPNNDLDSLSILEIGLIPNEFKFGINDYLAKQAGPGLPVKDLSEIILFNQEHPDKVKYGQDLLIASDANPGVGPLADVAAIPVIAASRKVADDMFARDNLDALIGPNAPYTGLGAAAGYPTIVVPAGYNGTRPQGLSFFGPAWSEARLLGYAYAYEQGTMRREPPTTVNTTLLVGVCPALAPESPSLGASMIESGSNTAITLGEREERPLERAPFSIASKPLARPAAP